ncbi:MAG: class I SAM-dependent methyltransferase [bacterium]|nr:class I SAM-dependent methyltransferase [bacterium]
MAHERDSNREAYNRIAEDWHRNHRDDTWWVEGTDKFISLLPAGASVLDAGCGGGTKAKYLSEHGIAVTGIDFAENLIAIARAEVPEAKFAVMDMYDLSGLAAEFDGVFAQAVLLHVPKREVPVVLHKLAGKVQPGGLFYIAVKEIKPGQPEEEARIENDYGYEYRRFFSYFILPELEGHIRPLGLEIVHADITPSGNSRWIQLIARKP